MRSLALLCSVLLAACEDEPNAVDRFRENVANQRPSGSAPTMTFVSSVPSSSAPTSPPPVLSKAYDLEAADARFRGWSVKAPADVDVQGDLDGARVRSVAFDLGIKLGPSDLPRFREGLLAGAAATKSEVTLTEDTKTSLAWTTTVRALKLYGFRSHLTTKTGEPFLCYTVTERESEADVEAHRDACATVTKK